MNNIKDIKAPVTIYVEVENILKARQYNLNMQEICREAISLVLSEMDKLTPDEMEEFLHHGYREQLERLERMEEIEKQIDNQKQVKL